MINGPRGTVISCGLTKEDNAKAPFSARGRDMKIKDITISKTVRDKDWGFTEASLPQFKEGRNGVGVLICHGFGGSPSNMRCLYDRAKELGCTAVMPLLTGHGKTLGDMEQADYNDWRRDVDEALDKLTEAGCEKIVLCGLSMGALLMADLAERKAGLELVDGLMLICPPVKMKRYLRVCSMLAPVIPYVETREEFPSADMEMYCGMATRSLADLKELGDAVRRHTGAIDMPTLIVEAGLDNRVDPASYRILTERIPQAEYVLMPDAVHGIPYSDKADELCGLFGDFLKRFISCEAE